MASVQRTVFWLAAYAPMANATHAARMYNPTTGPYRLRNTIANTCTDLPKLAWLLWTVSCFVVSSYEYSIAHVSMPSSVPGWHPEQNALLKNRYMVTFSWKCWGEYEGGGMGIAVVSRMSTLTRAGVYPIALRTDELDPGGAKGAVAVCPNTWVNVSPLMNDTLSCKLPRRIDSMEGGTGYESTSWLQMSLTEFVTTYDDMVRA
ncbi:hypothetical protein H257_09508 [Aphanomyces astaci]|uniref:Uncharacterized protein n=1 Tax=Aphanomyces astaci TaxID=112090 RepID=W4GC11_APHAT|nr:hypothetical protein H257_09508 [Aphanomyces astaci]ETV76498.1 hypothetical protein H257_09508 [Aphanomyces astaci]|eukprot:XP_009834043.1 hypothetical protein H257_09508 [Aphanomyces astaci]